MNKIYKLLLTSALFCWIFSTETYGQVSANFTWQNTCAGQQTYFTDNSTGPINGWNWDFGNGNYSNLQNPSNNYPSAGTFTVTLTVYDTSGYPFSKIQTVYIDACSQQLVADFGFYNTCKGDTTNFSDYSSGGTPVTSWYWNFGNGNYSSLQYPKFAFPDSGHYVVSLTVTNADTSASVSKDVYINDCTPQLNAYFNFNNTCLGDSTQFNDYSNGPAPVTVWNWNFGDGTYSNLQNPVHVYAVVGNYNVTLTVTDSAGVNKTHTKDVYLNDCTPPSLNADFGFYNTCKGDTTLFNDYSSGPSTITSWNWNFGNGNYSNLQHPVYAFPDTGNYTVSLTVTDVNSGSHSITKYIQINDCTPQLNAYFNFWNTCKGDSTHFNDYSQGPAPVVAWNWSLGDGSYSTMQHPAHLYADTGKYVVTLSVTDTANVTKTHTQDVYISDCTQPLYVDFGWWGNCINDTTHFNFNTNDTTINPSTSTFNWNFGDGGTSSDMNPAHKFANTGDQNVTLIVNHGTKSDTLVRMVYIDSCIQQIYVDFGWWGTCINDTTHFNFNTNDTTINPVTSTFNWNFGDGSVSSDMNPAHKFANTGEQNVTLVVNHGTKSDTIVRIVYIDSCIQPVYTDFNWWGTCISDTTHFNFYTNDTTINASTATFDWKFGDGNTSADMNPAHHFGSTGEHNVTLVVNHGTKSDTLVRMIYIDSCIQPLYVDFGWYGNCINDTTHFNFYSNDSTINSFNWNFGDGAGSTDINPSHTFASIGEHTVTLIASNGTIIDTIVRMIYVNDCGQAGNNIDFYWNGGCKGDSMMFNTYINATAFVPNTFNWNFGDGNVSADQNPMHVYADTGLYNVVLVASDSTGLSDTAYHQIYVNDCSSGTNLYASFGWNGGCAGEEVGFTDYSNGPAPIVSWHWNFGDGTTSTMQHPIHMYQDSGMYSVTLTVTDSANVMSNHTLQIYINGCSGGGDGYMDFNWYNTCAGTATTFYDQTTYEGVGYWIWNFGDGSTDSIQHPTHTFANAGTYNVTLMVFDSTMTQSDTLVKIVTVNSVTVNAGADITICEGTSTSLTATGNGTMYYWNTGGSAATIAVSPAATTTYFVYATDTMGCSASDSVTVTVSPNPVVTTTKTDATCGNANGSAAATVSGGVSPYTYIWSNGGTGATTSGLSAMTYTVMVTDANGCKGNANVNIGNSNGPSVASISSTPTTCPSYCDGSATVAATGGSTPYTYTWSTGQTTASITGVCAGTHSVTVKDANNCAVIASVDVTSTGINPSINGIVYIDSVPVVNGFINLYGINSAGAFDLVGTINITNGVYTFPDIPVGDYLMSAIADTIMYPFAIPTYLGYTHSWLGGDTLLTGCNSAVTMDLGIIDLTPMTGTGIVSGTIVNVTGGKRNSEPLPGVDVSLEEDPNGIIVAHTTTDDNGAFKFTNVEEGSYKIFVDIPGLGMVETHDVVVTASDTVSTNNNFFVDSTGTINIVPPTFIPTVDLTQSGTKVYPNPYTGSTNISYSVKERSMVVLEVYNLLGKRIAVLENDFKDAGDYKYNFGAKAIGESAGIYIIKLNVNNKVHTQRIIELD